MAITAQSPSHRAKSNAGFTLIELSIVILIIGFFMVGLVKAYELYQIQLLQREQDNKMDAMRSALADYIRDQTCVDDSGTRHPDSWCANNGGGKYLHLANEGTSGTAGTGTDAVRFPCPADPAAAPGASAYAAEIPRTDTDGDGAPDACDVSGTDVAEITDGGTVVGYRGAFPARTVDLPPSKLVDPYGNKYSYVVSADVVKRNALQGSQPAGKLEISDGGGPFSSRFALFSHGSNGGGAYSQEGNALSASATGDEAENTDDDQEFALRQGKYMAAGSSYYDDTFTASLVSSDHDGWWHALTSSGEDITHRNPGDVIMGTGGSGNVGIGTNTPGTKLRVEGGDATFGDSVGVGTNSPGERLDVDGNIALNDNLLFNSGEKISDGTNLLLKSDSGFMDLRPADSQHGLILRQLDGAGTAWSGIRTRNNGRMELRADGASYNQLALTDNGNVGIGTTSPSAKLDIKGAILPGHDGEAGSCESSKEGAMRYRTSGPKKGPQYCDGTKWRPVGNGVRVTNLITPDYQNGYQPYPGSPSDARDCDFVEYGGFENYHEGAEFIGDAEGSASTMTPVKPNLKSAINLGSYGDDATITLEFDASKNMYFKYREDDGDGGVSQVRLAFVRCIKLGGG